MTPAWDEVEPRKGRRRRLWSAAGVFLMLAVVHTWPLATDLRGLSRNDNADTMLNTWIVSWVAHQLPRDPLHLFDANIFHPHRNTLALSEPLIVPGAMAIPLEWLGVSPVLTYNLLLLVGFILTALAMYAVIVAWTGDHMAGLLAGAVLAFNAHTMTRLPHLQAIHAQWFPLALWALDRLLTGQRTRDALWLGLFVLLLALTSGYLAVFVTFALGAAMLVRPREWWGRRGRPVLVRLAATAVVTVVVAAAVLWPYRQMRVEEGLRRELHSVDMYSASPWSYVTTTARLHYDAWSHRIFRHRTEEVLFPGATALGLCGVALVIRRRTLGAGRRRMLVAIAAVGFVMSLGTTTPVYAWAYHLFPPMQGMRAAARFGYLVLFAVAALAGIGVAEIRHRLSRRWAGAIAIGAFALVGVEALHTPLPFERFDGIPGIYRLIAQDPDPVGVVDLPVFAGAVFHRNASYMLASTQHWKPLLNGYSGARPAGFDETAQLMNTFPSSGSVERLRQLGVRYVLVHLDLYRDRDRGEKVVSDIADVSDLELLAVHGNDQLYRLRGVDPPAADVR